MEVQEVLMEVQEVLMEVQEVLMGPPLYTLYTPLYTVIFISFTHKCIVVYSVYSENGNLKQNPSWADYIF